MMMMMMIKCFQSSPLTLTASFSLFVSQQLLNVC